MSQATTTPTAEELAEHRDRLALEVLVEAMMADAGLWAVEDGRDEQEEAH